MSQQPNHAPRDPGSGRLEGRVALITGATQASGARLLSCSPAKAPGPRSCTLLSEDADAQATLQEVMEKGRTA
ncbi:hypothetical protein TQ29_02300 [Actibacterium sp. EMB200-NS6]|nr:hypothetical protein TQ29_02300 [Actibacterium sp. EMB200-NS6]